MKKSKIGQVLFSLFLLVSLIFAAVFLVKSNVFLQANEKSEGSSAKATTNLAITPFANDSVANAPTVDLASAVRFKEAKSNQLGGIALDDMGNVWTWGYNAYGMLGYLSSAGGYGGGMKRLQYFLDQGITIESIEAGYHTNYAVSDTGVVYAWGYGLEGQMGNGTTTNNNPTPVVVSSLAGKRIVEVYASIYVSSPTSCAYAIDEDGKVYAWGYADGYRIPGSSGYVSSAKEITSLSDLKIKQMELGNQHGIALATDGKVYTWGYGADGRLGHGNVTTYETPKEVTFFTGKNVKQVSANYRSSLVLVENADGSNTVYQFGAIYKSAAATSITSPEAVVFDLSSSAYGYDEMPKINAITAGAYVNYAVDQYGRLWSWGHNLYYSFGTDGGLQNKLSTSVAQATQQPVTMGDGDTQGTTTAAAPRAPVFSGRSSFPTTSYRYYEVYGQWTSLTDGLHPTIYDKKYMKTTGEFSRTSASNLDQQAETHAYVYPVDSQDRRLVYVVRRASDNTYNGNFYVVEDSYNGKWIVNNGTATNLPTGITETTSTPAVLEDELSWINIAVDAKNFDYTGNDLKEVPYMAKVDTLQSSSLLLDASGNLYKMGYDGSGAVAWGWDYSEYEFNTAGNNANYGLYNMYTYELMFMRGVPRLSETAVTVKSPIKKIYKSEANQEQLTDLKVSLGKATVSSQLNITIEPELSSARYLIIPYDKADTNFSITNLTLAEFNAVYDSAAALGYESGDLIALNQGQGQWGTLKNTSDTKRLDLVDNGNIIIKDNCVLWVMTTTTGYSATVANFSRTVYDNYYTDTTLYHNGKNIADPYEEVYSANSDYVEKTSALTPGEVADAYGLPLDKNGAVIEEATFKYDEVTIRPYTSADPEYLAKELNYYLFVSGQTNPVVLELDDLSYLETAVPEYKYIHTFEYERDPKMWIKVTYKGRYAGTTTDISPYVMDGLPGNEGIVSNTETVKRSTATNTITLTRTPGEVTDSRPVNFTVDDGVTQNFDGNGKVVFNTTTSTTAPEMVVIIYYGQSELYVRQVIKNPNGEIVVPTQGYFGLNNTDGTTVANTYNVIVKSGDNDSVGFKKVQLTTDGANNKYAITPVVPQMYKYYGYRISTTEANHGAAVDVLAPANVLVDFSSGSKYYVTIYLEPTVTESKDIPFYNWDYKLNKFGEIKK